ncbi:probable 28S ribosomal protein S26, mitochondrial [Stegodyphus dumicola]|uniref:probable 28S ribosomal protein S26, mitochondrial n=1 Tax=Stegodyphus dumicola TaxID=202533 RepID=UPI0015B350C9|nr:probable 28S ribosomal protein S26, mitochondrial [Stegodyphus dumicola]
MAFVLNKCFPCVWSPYFFGNIRLAVPVTTQLRWKKIPIRKPMWLPTAPSKLYRIPEHPYVPPDEKELIAELLEEYYCKVESLRQLFQAEVKQKDEDEGNTLEQQQKDEAEFRLLLEENKKENERIRAIREETSERLFQEKQLELLQLEEERKLEEQRIKERVEDIVRKEKEMSAFYINYDNLDTAIEQAMDNPVNVNFAITPAGDVIWEGKPPPEYEENVIKRISEGKKL